MFRYVNLLTQANRLDDAIAIARTAWEVDNENEQVRDLLNRLLDTRKEKAKTGHASSRHNRPRPGMTSLPLVPF